MKYFAQTLQRKHMGWGVAGLVLVAIAIGVLPRLLGSKPNPSGATTEPSPPDAINGANPIGYDENVKTMVDIVRATEKMGPKEARQRISELLKSGRAVEQASGLALLAGRGMLDASSQVSGHAPEVLLAAVDLCGALFGDEQAKPLIERWAEGMGGARTAGEEAHTLLLEAGLPYGGGSAALDLMQSVNDPQAILVGLQEFAANPELPPSIRARALLLLHGRMDPGAYLDFARFCVKEAEEWEAGSAWVARARRWSEWVAALPMDPSAPLEVDGAFIAETFSKPYPGLVEDLEMFLQNGVQEGWVAVDEKSAAWVRESIARLDETTLAGPDSAAWQRLRRQMGSWAGRP